MACNEKMCTVGVGTDCHLYDCEAVSFSKQRNCVDALLLAGECRVKRDNCCIAEQASGLWGERFVLSTKSRSALCLCAPKSMRRLDRQRC